MRPANRPTEPAPTHHTNTRQSPTPPTTGTHDLIRVQGARVNNLKDVSVEIPKRRLTVFTGISGSGKSSLVFGTIAAESQRLINETYSTFVQGFMPTLARPEVDVLEGLTTAIIVDQERMGANARSTVGTATDANAMLRVLFSRLGQPHIGSLERVLIQRPVGPRGRCDHDGTRCRQDRETHLQQHRRHVPALRRPGHGLRYRPHAALRRLQVTRRGRDHHPRLQDGQLVDNRRLHRVGLPRPGQAHQQVHQERAPGLPLQGAGQGEGQRRQPHVRGADPQAAEVDALQGPRRAAAAHSGVRGSGRHLQGLPRLWRHPAQRRGPLLANRRHQHRRRLRDADQRSRRMGPWRQRAVGGTVARHAAADPRVRSRRSDSATSRSSDRRARSRAARRNG